MMDRDLFGEIVAPPASSMLATRFGVPPFSVLSARDGDWQERKRQWLALGIKSELGRGESLQEMAAGSLGGGGLTDIGTQNARPGGGAVVASLVSAGPSSAAKLSGGSLLGYAPQLMTRNMNYYRDKARNDGA